MATRDLTTQYLRLRSAMHRKRGPDAVGPDGNTLMDGAGNTAVDMTALSQTASPVYVDLVTDINSDINHLGSRMGELRAAHEARLRITFDPAAEEQKEQEIQIITSEITRMFNIGGAKLKRLANFDSGVEGAEIKLRKNIQRGLATRLHDMSTDFRKDQKHYIGTMTKFKKGGSINDLIGISGKADTDEGFSDEQMHELATAEEDTDERMREIQRIAKSVEDLAVLFKELATLVVEQGTILDRIDYNMEQTVEATQKGVEELKGAEKYQKSARPVKCMMFLMVLILVFVIIIIVRKSPSSA